MSAIHDRRGKSRCWAPRGGSGVREGKLGMERGSKGGEEETESQGRAGAEAGEGQDSESILNSCQLSVI